LGLTKKQIASRKYWSNPENKKKKAEINYEKYHTDEEFRNRQRKALAEWYKKNRTKVLKKQNKYNEANKERIAERQRKYYLTHKEDFKRRRNEQLARDKKKKAEAKSKTMKR